MMKALPNALLILLLGFSQFAGAGVQIDADANGVALQGHDPVAYFTEGKPVAGKADYTAEYNGASYHFASAENRDLFVSEPDRYAPQYGGYCAFGTTFKMKVPGDPSAFKVVDDKLYINSSPDILSRWSQDITGNIGKANNAWPEIIDKSPEELKK
jgi:YHS domain-containing protein